VHHLDAQPFFVLRFVTLLKQHLRKLVQKLTVVRDLAGKHEAIKHF